MGKRRFGRVRKLPSGRWQARYLGPDGIDRPAPRTFPTKTDADTWLTDKEAEIRGGNWIDPDLGKVSFESYATAWVADRVLRPRTEELYRGLLQNHLIPFFGNWRLDAIREADVRHWRKQRLLAGPSTIPPFGQVTVAKAYRLLRAIFNTAVDDGLIRRNPCRIKGAGQEHLPERLIVPLPEFMRLLDAIPVRYRAMLLLATFASLRFGELAALRRDDLDLDAGTVTVFRSLAQMNDGSLVEADPKSAASRRVVSIPPEIVPEMRWHLERFAEPGESGYVFVGPKGGRLRRKNFRVVWAKACEDAGLPGVHFHDLRHTGNTLAAATGASLRELMERMGHSSPRAALIYQHASKDRDKAIANAVGEMLAAARKQAKSGGRSGTQRARKRPAGS